MADQATGRLVWAANSRNDDTLAVFSTLWTDAALESARTVYQSAGFVLSSQAPHNSFGHKLLGEQWMLDRHNKPKPE